MYEPENNFTRPTAAQIEKEIERLETRKEIRKSIADTVKNLVFIAALAVLLSNLFISVLTVNKGSMHPNLRDGEAVVAFRAGGINQGDIIAFHYNNKVLLKRVIAKAGDWVSIDEHGTVYINGEALDEPYLIEKSYGEIDIEMPYQVPDGAYFVMGDQRASSADSRLAEIGPVSDEHIIGRIVMRIWPLDRLGAP